MDHSALISCLASLLVVRGRLRDWSVNRFYKLYGSTTACRFENGKTVTDRLELS